MLGAIATRLQWVLSKGDAFNMNMSIRMWVVVIVLSGLGAGLRAQEPEPVEGSGGPGLVAPLDFARVRALWVTRYDFKTRDDIARVMNEAAALGITDVIWQARGQADAFYADALEPWGEEICTKGADGLPVPPGFDPLAEAVTLAHGAGLRLHAWFNVMPLWKGKVPPKAVNHPYLALPGLGLRDLAGHAQPLNDHYVIVNPANEDTHVYLSAVVRDIASRYAIDGLHLDYVRFVSDTMDATKVYPGDADTIAAFEAATGATFSNTPQGLLVYRGWLRERITALVRSIKVALEFARPGTPLTAAVWRRPDLARETYLQDAAAWLKEGTLQHAFPMIYTVKDEQFRSDLDAWLEAAPAGTISPGLGTYLHPAAQSPVQLEYALSMGVTSAAIFAYSALFECADPNQTKTEAARNERAARRAALAAYLAGHVVSLPDKPQAP